MPHTIEVEGLDRLRSTLDQASTDMAEFRSAHSVAARTAASRARSIAPRRTGALAGSIFHTTSRKAGIIGASERYARPVHQGSRVRGTPPRPFLSEGARQTEATWIRSYTDHVTDTLKSVKGK